MNKWKKLLSLMLVLVLLTGCGISNHSADSSTEQNQATGSAVTDEKFEGQEISAYRKYLEERSNVSDLYFTCLYISDGGKAVLALTHEKNAVDKEAGYITASHIVLNNYIDKEVVQVKGSSMDSFSNTARISYADGKMFVPVYGGAGSYTVSEDKIQGTVYATEAGNSTSYQVDGKKRTKPASADADTVSEIVKQQNEVAVPIRFYKNTKENREQYL